MKNLLFLLNIVTLVVAVGVLLWVLIISGDILSSQSLVADLKQLEGVVTAERRDEAIRNLLVGADSRLDRASSVITGCVLLCVVSVGNSVLTWIRSKKS